MQSFPQLRLALLQEPTAIIAKEIQEIQDGGAETTRCQLQSMPLREVRRKYSVQDELLLLQTLQERILFELSWESAQGRVRFEGDGYNAADVGLEALSIMPVLYLEELRMRSHEMQMRVRYVLSLQ